MIQRKRGNGNEVRTVGALGVFTYDSRSNEKSQRRWTGFAAAGETVRFTRPFKTRPIVFCHGELAVKIEDVTATEVTFSGEGSGGFEVIGE